MTAPRDRRVVIEVDEPIHQERPMNRSMATTHSDVRARVGNISLWILQIALGGLFAFNFGLGKVMGSEQSVELFADIGVGQWLRHVTGILEIAGGIGLLIPRLSGVAALGLVGVMGCALITEVFIVDGSLVAPLIWLICAATIAWFRRDHVLALIRQLRALRSSTGS
ncbi:DoxX family protein [Streptomyces phaeochromogenes]|uniref:DoxX family protein n=1 Tax=Streptomyces phaeochromogenes TaxID=1923 RepID=UPI002252F734|nr:DoxX family protein [Streptomyces phaeochromogenes]MCX5602548.1 DoxX family protein [Streptomyces phaeochromogenes]